MNKTIELKIREDIKEMIQHCTYPQQMLFKRIYSPNNLEASVNEVIDNIDVSKLGHAFFQIERTIIKNTN